MSLYDAMSIACVNVGIGVPRKVQPGRWAKSAVIGKSAKNTSGRVLVFDDEKGGIAHNWATGQQQIFRAGDKYEAGTAPRPTRRDPERERREAEERAEVERICARMVATARQEPHPYLAAKGFSDELGLVIDDPRTFVPAGRLGEMIAAAMPAADRPILVVPGRIGKQITTVQFITPEGEKKNILRGMMGGASHRIATGRLTVVCEGIATAYSVRAALRLLNVSTTVLSAFSASNVASVARGIPGAIIAADHDKPIESLHGKGTGEFYAEQSGCRWIMPPQPGDFNDWHQADGLRAVALHLRKAIPP